jgi:hypothetical protein
LSEAGNMAEIKISIRVSAWVTPPRGMDTDRAHKRPQSQLSPLSHDHRSNAVFR